MYKGIYVFWILLISKRTGLEKNCVRCQFYTWWRILNYIIDRFVLLEVLKFAGVRHVDVQLFEISEVVLGTGITLPSYLLSCSPLNARSLQSGTGQKKRRRRRGKTAEIFRSGRHSLAMSVAVRVGFSSAGVIKVCISRFAVR